MISSSKATARRTFSLDIYLCPKRCASPSSESSLYLILFGVDVGFGVAVGFGVDVAVGFGVDVAVGFGVDVGFGVAVAVGFGVGWSMASNTHCWLALPLYLH